MVEKKNELDQGIVPYVLVGGGIAGGCLLGYFLLPEILKLFNPQQPKIQNPEPKPQNIQQEQTSNPDLWIPQPNYTFGGGKKLYRFSHSATSKDQETLESQFKQKQLLEKMEFDRIMNQKSWKPKTVDLSPPSDTRLMYGSDGHSKPIKVKTPRKTVRQRWRLKR